MWKRAGRRRGRDAVDGEELLVDEVEGDVDVEDVEAVREGIQRRQEAFWRKKKSKELSLFRQLGARPKDLLVFCRSGLLAMAVWGVSPSVDALHPVEAALRPGWEGWTELSLFFSPCFQESFLICWRPMVDDAERDAGGTKENFEGCTVLVFSPCSVSANRFFW